MNEKPPDRDDLGQPKHEFESGDVQESTNERNAITESSDFRKICRFCFEEEETQILNQKKLCSLKNEKEQHFVDPCGCKGSNRWVHRTCLIKWQKTLLMQHSSEDENRHSICSVCKVEFSIKPPSQLSLLIADVGDCIAGMISPGSLLIASEKMSHPVLSDFRHIPLAFRTLLLLKRKHWQKSIYLIFEVKARRSHEDNPGLDWVFALNLAREMKGEDSEEPIPVRILSEIDQHPEIMHHNGGPVNWGKPEGLRGMFICSQDISQTDNISLPLYGSSRGMHLVINAFERILELTETCRPARLHTFSGCARWSRSQLLAEIRRGSWGVIRNTDAWPFYLARDDELKGLWENLSQRACYPSNVNGLSSTSPSEE